MAGAERARAPRRYLSLRWKLALALALLVTLLAGAAFAVLDVVLAQGLQERLRQDARRAAEAAAASVDGAQLAQLAAAVPAGPFDATALEAQERALADLARAVPLERVYTYVGDRDGGAFRLAGVGFNADGRPLPAEGAVPSPSRLQLAGLAEPRVEGRGSDGDTSWGLSAYHPVLLDGRPVGAVSADFSVAFVEQAQAAQRRVLLTGLGLGYVVVLSGVLLVSRSLTSRLRRVTAVADRMGEGGEVLRTAPEHLVEAGSSRVADELATLAAVLADMGRRVGERERTLVAQVQRLTVQVDEARKRRDVASITESPGFDDLLARAAALRRGRSSGTAAAAPPAASEGEPPEQVG